MSANCVALLDRTEPDYGYGYNWSIELYVNSKYIGSYYEAAIANKAAKKLADALGVPLIKGRFK